MNLSFVMLEAAICAAWLPAMQVRQRRLSPWVVLLAMALCVASIARVVTPAGVVAVLALYAVAALSIRTGRSMRPALTCAAGVLAVTLSIHAMPGFHNPILWHESQISFDGIPFTYYLNFDKGVAGLILVGVYGLRMPGVANRATATLALVATPALVFSLAMAMGYVRFDPKLPDRAATFLLANLLLTVLPEEAFFRGLLQAGLASVQARNFPAGPKATGARAAVVFSSGVLFGLAHSGGGLAFSILSCTAGVGYAVAFDAGKRLEYAIALHFAVNAIHFLAFTYPALAT